MRNKARRIAIKAGVAKRNDGKDIHHKDGNAMNNKRSNLTVKTASKNRSFPRTRSAAKKYKYSQENKMVGRVQKEINRKKRTESRMAQRTGKSAKDRAIEKLLKNLKKGDMQKLKDFLKHKKKKKQDWRKSIEV